MQNLLHSKNVCLHLLLFFWVVLNLEFMCKLCCLFFRLGCLCKDNAKTLLPLTLVSKGERMNARLMVEHTHAASNYFKHSAPLFEARYQFVHGPACGPATITASNDGELHFPHKDYYMQTHYASPQYYYADNAHQQSTSAPHTQENVVRCIWELKVCSFIRSVNCI